MEKLKTNELSLGLNQTLRNDLVDNFEKIQKGVDGQSDSLNKQILDMLGNVAPQDQNEVTQARIDANGQAYSTMKSRLDVDQKTAETALEEERQTNSEVTQARTNSLGKYHQTLSERLNDQENELTNAMNDKLSQINFELETFPNLAALQAKYPNGKTGLFVTIDNMHKYIWDSGKWIDGGVYQTAALARGSVSMDKLDEVNPEQLVNTLAVSRNAVPWSNALVLADSNTITINKDKSREGDDFGFSVPVFLDKLPIAGDQLYLNFDYQSSAVANDGDLDKMEVWLLDASQNMVQKISPFFYASVSKTSYQLIISADTLNTAKVGKNFYLMVAIHNDITLNVSNLRVNWDNADKEIKLKTNNNKALIAQTRKSAGFTQNYDLYVSSEVAIAKSNDPAIKPVIEIPYFGLDLTKTVYFVLDAYTDPNTTSFAHFWLSKLSSNTPNARIQKGSGRIEMVLEPNELVQKGVTKDGVIVLTTGDNSKEGLIINHVSLSNEPIDGNLDDALNNIQANMVSRNVTKLGQPISDISTAAAASIADVDFATPQAVYHGANGILKAVKAYVKAAGNYTFKIAKIDQNNLMVDETNTFTLALVAGLNALDVENQAINVPDGAQLFMDISKSDIFNPDSSHLYATTALIRDKSHPTTNAGYSGQMFYDAKVLIPFNYEVIDGSPIEALKELRSSVDEHESEIVQLVIAKDNVVIKSPSGKPFRLVVSDDGTLSAVSQIPNKVAVFGNSLTKYSAIGDFGLAASNQNSDWFGLVKNHVAAINSSVHFYRGTIGGWEGATNSADRQNYFDNTIKPNLSADTDLVIIQAGDNVNTAEKAASFATDAKQLIANIKQVSQNARVLWVASWFVSKFDNVDLIQSIKQACQDTGATYVDITGYSSVAENNSYIGAKITKPDGTVITVTDNGYAAHPGDKGHKIIADTVNSYMGF